MRHSWMETSLLPSTLLSHASRNSSTAAAQLYLLRLSKSEYAFASFHVSVLAMFGKRKEVKKLMRRRTAASSGCFTFFFVLDYSTSISKHLSATLLVIASS
ncbi:hypothetical protein M0R45_030835 [Rubus argutus]|uniref:Uncharacterized protein n=1 Tax=Rubus argutus TaxID=59490 RepID=A0AAW1WEE4_RUBAR